MSGRCIVLIGAQWGDEGKGKFTDYLAKGVDISVRYQGGDNAGHTIEVGNRKYKFHLIPSAALRKGITAVIGNGCVVNPDTLLEELRMLKTVNNSLRLLISDKAHLLMQYHRLQDELEERFKNTGGFQAGTTRKGIGPAYVDKAGRFGIRFGDLLDLKSLESRIPALLKWKSSYLLSLLAGIEEELGKKEYNEYVKKIKNACDKDNVSSCLKMWSQKLKDHICDTTVFLNHSLREGKDILLEGAQGTHLDIDHGTYPYVTSSSTAVGGAVAGAGIPAASIRQVIGIAKAYTTRVGAGPFPTELRLEGNAVDIEKKLKRNISDNTEDARNSAVAEHLSRVGNEFGTTTGRRRRVGWLDLVVLRHSAMINGFTELAITKLDVLGGVAEKTGGSLKVCTHYEYEDKGVVKRLEYSPSSNKMYDRIRPVYIETEGWKERTEKEWAVFCRELNRGKVLSEMDPAIADYVKLIEAGTGVKVSILSFGAERNMTARIKKNKSIR
ncbi:MAG: adenylosuccinate synthase [Thermoplasmata archaeon]